MESPSRSLRLAAVAVDLLLVVVLFVLRYPGLPQVVTLAAAVGILALLGYQCYLLAAEGQTIGKRALKLRIVRVDDGQNGGFLRNVVLRQLLGRWLLGMIPFYLLVDALFIFRGDHRCLHDLIAGTRVIQDADAGA